MDDFLEFWQFGPLKPYLHFGENGAVAANLATGDLALAAMVRTDTLPTPPPEDIGDADLRAAHLARAEEAVAVIEAGGWRLVDPKLSLQWGEAATWLPANVGVDPLIIGTGLARVTCWLESRLTPA